jgi:hypothetical protein
MVVTLLGAGALGLELNENSEADSVGIGLAETLRSSKFEMEAFSFRRCRRMQRSL